MTPQPDPPQPLADLLLDGLHQLMDKLAPDSLPPPAYEFEWDLYAGDFQDELAERLYRLFCSRRKLEQEIYAIKHDFYGYQGDFDLLGRKFVVMDRVTCEVLKTARREAHAATTVTVLARLLLLQSECERVDKFCGALARFPSSKGIQTTRKRMLCRVVSGRSYHSLFVTLAMYGTLLGKTPVTESDVKQARHDAVIERARATRDLQLAERQAERLAARVPPAHATQSKLSGKERRERKQRLRDQRRARQAKLEADAARVQAWRRAGASPERGDEDEAAHAEAPDTAGVAEEEEVVEEISVEGTEEQREDAVGKAEHEDRAAEERAAQPEFGVDPADDGPDDGLRCPLTRQLFKQPLIASDGYTYEAAALRDWRAVRGDVSPSTGEPLVGEPIRNFLVERLLEVLAEDALAEDSSACGADA